MLSFGVRSHLSCVLSSLFVLRRPACVCVCVSSEEAQGEAHLEGLQQICGSTAQRMAQVELHTTKHCTEDQPATHRRPHFRRPRQRRQIGPHRFACHTHTHTQGHNMLVTRWNRLTFRRRTQQEKKKKQIITFVVRAQTGGVGKHMTPDKVRHITQRQWKRQMQRTRPIQITA